MFRVIALLATLLLSTTAGAASPAEAVVENFHQALLANMKQGQTLGCAGRINKLRPVIENGFDLPYLAQKILRKRWSGLTEAQREDFVVTLGHMVVATYADRFSSFKAESFSNTGTEELARGNRVVHSKFRHGSGTVSFDYVLHETAGRWRIVNVIAEGVSDLAIRSAQYEGVFKQKGFDGLIAYMQEQTAKSKTGC